MFVLYLIFIYVKEELIRQQYLANTESDNILHKYSVMISLRVVSTKVKHL